METKILQQSIEDRIIEVTEDPVIKTYTEQEIDNKIEMANDMVTTANIQLEFAQRELDKWTALKGQFEIAPIGIKQIIK